jgi:hypothetical protein
MVDRWTGRSHRQLIAAILSSDRSSVVATNRIDETFNFYGESTLLAYGPADGDSPDNAKVFPGWETAESVEPETTLPSFRILREKAVPRFQSSPTNTTHLIVKSFINSHVTSSLAGPEFGFQYELGDRKGVRFSGTTRVAAMFNEEKDSPEWRQYRQLHGC